MPDQPLNVVVNYNHATPPLFDNVTKKDAELHWLLFLDYLEEAKVVEAEKVAKFRITLQEYPRRWYAKNQATFTDLNTLENLFKAKFQPVISSAEYFKRFQDLSLKPNESLNDYKTRVAITASKAGINTEELMVSQFVSGLPNAIRMVVRAQKDKTLDAVTQTAQAAYVDCLPAPTADTVLAVQSAAGPKLDLADAMGSLYVSRGDQSPYRRSGRSPSNTRSRHDDWQSSRYDRKDRYDSGRFNRGPPSRNGRSSSRSASRDRNSFRRPRDQTPRGEDRKVKFNRPRSQSPLICKFCKKQGHALGQCRSLLKMIESGQVTCPEDF